MTTPARLILASASPRRLKLLAQLGLHPQVHPADIDESPRQGEAPADYVLRIAQQKAAAIAAAYPADSLIIAADTSVVLGDTILGKPVDHADCQRLLRLLSQNRHEVLSAVAIQPGCRDGANNQQPVTALSRSEVWLRAISDAELLAYCQSHEPHDKAGGYAVQGLAAIFIEKISGSYSGIMGLPLFETSQLLAGFGVAPLDQFRNVPA